MDLNRLLAGLAMALLISVSGCGGGGGGASNGSDDPANPPVASTTGLVPEAGPAGATLYADASPLRVLRDGAVWTYHGVDSSSPYTPRAYTDTVKHVATSGGMLESGDNVFNDGPDTTGPLRYEGGAYKYTAHMTLTPGAPALTVNVVELRSPVKVNDQYTSLDKRIADSGTDADGDTVNDALDVALYTRVIGEEVLDLPNRSHVKAVRVDTTLRARIIGSKAGTALAQYQAVQSNWYASGLGIVQMRLSESDAIDPSFPNRVFTEVLQNWDGLTEGLGHTDVVAGVAPASSPLGGAALQYPLDAVGFDTHAVVATLIPGQPSAVGVAIAQLDTRGKVMAARGYTREELFPDSGFFTEPRLLRMGNELRLLARTANGSVSMVAFDATGQHILRPAVILLSDPQSGTDYQNTSYRVATDGNGIWLGWVRIIAAPDSVYLRSLLVQHVDDSGQALGPARTVLEPVQGDIRSFRMALSDSRLAVSWLKSGLSAAAHLALVDTGSSALLADKTLDSAYGPCTYASCPDIFTLSLQPGIAMIFVGSSSRQIDAVRLDVNGEPIISAGAPLATDALKAPWLARANGGGVFNGLGGRLIAAVGQYGKYWPEDIGESGFTSVFQTNGTSGPLAASEPVLLARFVGFPNVLTTVQLGNRLLLIGGDGAGYLNSMVVWTAD